MTNNLYVIRTKQNLSIRKLSELSGVACNQIQRMERFEINPTIMTIVKLSNSLNVRICDIYDCDKNRCPYIHKNISMIMG